MAELIVLDSNLETWLEAEFDEIKETSKPEFTSLIKSYMAVMEHSYRGYCSKEKFMQEISNCWDFGKMQRSEMPFDSERLQSNVYEQFPNATKDELVNLVRAAAAAHEHSIKGYNIPKEKFMEWVGMAWQAGRHQKRVDNLEIEGNVTSSRCIARNIGAYLSLFGEKTGGYISGHLIPSSK